MPDADHPMPDKTEILFDSGRAGVLVIQARNVAVPLLGAEAASRYRASTCQQIVAQMKEVAEVPQQHSPVASPSAVARVCPSGANATEATQPGGAGQRLTETAWFGSVGQIPQQHRPIAPALARVRPSGANATDVTPPVWPVSGSPSRRGRARSARSHSSTLPSSLGAWRGYVRPGRTPPRSSRIGVAGQRLTEAAWLGSVGQIPQQYRSSHRSSGWPGFARPGRTPPSHPVDGRSAAGRGGVARPGRPDPTAAPFPCRRAIDGGGQGPPVRGERHRMHPAEWPVSGLPRRRGLARSARSHSCTVPSSPALRRQVSARPGRTPPSTPPSVWPVSGLPRRRGLAQSARSQSSTVPSSSPLTVARVRPSGANATDITR